MDLSFILNMPVIRSLLGALGEDAALHLVGGALRDLYLGNKPKDLDFATRFRPEEVITRLEASGIKWVQIGIRRGTVAAVIDGESYEITTFRNPLKETEYTDNITDDLPARDFTINAIALCLSSGQIIDPFDGIVDLKLSRLKAVGDPTRRFTEDPHRILRMVRFGICQGRSIDAETELAAQALVKELRGISLERVREELVKILISHHAGNALRYMLNLGILEQVLPELLPTVGLSQNKWHVYDVFTHITTVIDHCPQDKIIRLAALLHDIGKPRCVSDDESGRHFYQHEH